MAWIESHQTLSKHRKTLSTAGRLSVDRHTLIGHLMELWWWGLDNVPSDGFMGNTSDLEIAMAAEWRGDSTEFVNALIDGGFIDEKPDGRWLHDWFDYAGKLLVKREKEKERSKSRRSTTQKTTKRPTVDRRSTEEKPSKVARHSNSNSNRITTTTTKESDVDSSQDKPMASDSEIEPISLEDYCHEIEMQMVAEGANSNYMAKESSFEWIKTFHASNVPVDFVKRGISAVFEREEKKGKRERVKSFAYCAQAIQDLWLREVSSQQPAEAIRISIAATAERGGANDGRTRESPKPSEYGEDVRNAFYSGRWDT